LMHCALSLTLSVTITPRSRSRTFYPNVTTLPSGRHTSIRRLSSSVTFLHPTQPVKIFRNISTPFCNLPSADLRAKFYRDQPGESLRRGLNARGVVKYSDVGPVEGYISECRIGLSVSLLSGFSNSRLCVLQ